MTESVARAYQKSALHRHIVDQTRFAEPGCSKDARRTDVIFERGADAIQIGGVELDTFDPDDRLTTFKHVFKGDPADWFGHYAPTGEAVDQQDLDGWKLWLRIEPA